MSKLFLKNIISLLILAVLLNSCTKFGTDFNVKNYRETDIDSVIISNGYSKVELKNLKKNQTREIFLDFRVNNPKNDGGYNIQIYSKGITSIRNFGYYSNGIPSNSYYNIGILKDSLIIEEKFK